MNLPPGGFPWKDKIVTWSDFPEAQMLHRVVSRHMSISFNHVSYDKISAFLTIPQLLLNIHWSVSFLACGIHKASIVLQSKSNQHREKTVTSRFLDTVLLLKWSKITRTFWSKYITLLPYIKPFWQVKFLSLSVSVTSELDQFSFLFYLYGWFWEE